MSLRIDKSFKKHLNGVLIRNHVIIETMQNDTWAADIRDAFDVVEPLLNEDIGDPAAQLARNMVDRLDRTN